MSKEASHHVLPMKIYIGVWLALIVLTVVTVWVSFFDFGPFNMVVAMAVATVKAGLVSLFFMHLLYDDKFNLVAFLGSFVFVGLFFVFTFADEATRGQYEPVEGNFVKEMPAAPTAGALGKKPEHGAGHSEAAPAGAAPAAH